MRRIPPLIAIAMWAWPLHCLTAQTLLPGLAPAGSTPEIGRARPLWSSVNGRAIRQHLGFLTNKPRVAGTPAQVESADYVLRELATYGFDTTRVEYRVYLPYPESTQVDRKRPQFVKLPLRLLLNEIPVPGDSVTDAMVWPVMAAYSGGADVSGPLVFANLGRPEDYRMLDSMGLSARGKIVVARLGFGSRAAKARNAESNGALGLLLYSDPADDGYFAGDPYPVGQMRPPDGVERFSLLLRDGDPSTPGWPSTAEARRLPRHSMALPGIPVVPIGYRNAMHLLPALGGPSVPQAWQGALPLRYHVGGDTTTVVRLAVWPEGEDRAYKTIVNTIATLRGTELPDEIVLAGAHRDAWGRGAADNASGVATLLEAARVLGAGARGGHRPQRTIVLATWDASEWGHIGVTEYVEQFGSRLRGRVVAYLNHDTSVSGRKLSVAADPSLGQLFREVAEVVPGLEQGQSVLDDWRRSAGSRPAPVPVESSEYCGDCAPIRSALGAPALEFGFRGPNGLLHSAYDSPLFTSTLADPELRAHVAAARLSATLLDRAANGSNRTLGTSSRDSAELRRSRP